MSSQQLIPRIDPEQEELLQERRAARMMRRKQQIRARILLWFTISVSILLLSSIGFAYLQIQNSLAHNSLYPPLSGISCDSMEHNNYHIHVHFTIYINGEQVTIPA